MEIIGNALEVTKMEKGLNNCIMQLGESIKRMNAAVAGLDTGWRDLEYQQVRDVVLKVMESVSNHLEYLADLRNGLIRYRELLERDSVAERGSSNIGSHTLYATPNNYSETRETWQKTYDAIVYDSPIEKRKELELNQGKVDRFKGTCGLCSCVNVLRLAGVAISEEEMVAFARDNHLCTNHFWMMSAQNGGTSAEDRQKILKHFGISSMQMQPDIESIATAVENGKGVIISVHAYRLWYDMASTTDFHAVTITSVKRDRGGNILGFYIADSGIHEKDGVGYYSRERLENALTKRPMNVTTQIIR